MAGPDDGAPSSPAVRTFGDFHGLAVALRRTHGEIGRLVNGSAAAHVGAWLGFGRVRVNRSGVSSQAQHMDCRTSMTTAHQAFPRQSSSLAAASSPLPRGLPAPSERRRLREQWGLSTRQVAAAFGVTPATVRSWEGSARHPGAAARRRTGDSLRGLAQHGAHSPAGVPARSPGRGRRPACDTGRAVHPPTAVGTGAPPLSVSPARPAGAGVLRMRNVSRGGADPVSAGRIRRLRLLWAAACVWSLAWWVILTCPTPL